VALLFQLAKIGKIGISIECKNISAVNQVNQVNGFLGVENTFDSVFDSITNISGNK